MQTGGNEFRELIVGNEAVFKIHDNTKDVNTEVILTNVKCIGNKARAYFWDHGVVSFEVPNYRFGTKILSKKDEEKVREDFENNPELSEYKLIDFKRVFNILHAYLPLSKKDKLPKFKKREKETDAFITKYNSEQIRARYLTPGWFTQVPNEILDALKLKKEFESRLGKLKEKIKETYKEKSEMQITRIFNELNRAHLEGRENEILTNNLTKNLDQIIIDERKSIEYIHTKIKTVGKTKYHEDKETLEIIVDDIDKVKRTRPMTLEEINSKKCMFIDIEVPYYKRPDAKVTWVGISYYEKGKIKEEIHVMHKTSVTNEDGFEIIPYKTEEELINGVRDSVKKENPYYVIAFNNRYDLMKLREAAERSEAGETFSIGEEDSNPILEVNKKLFERIGIPGREVIDFLRVAKILYSGLPNQKLGTIVQKQGLAKNLHEAKTSSYKDLEEIETFLFKSKDEVERAKKLRIVAYYLGSGDVRNLRKMHLLHFQGVYGLAQRIGAKENIPFTYPLYSATLVNNAQKRLYEENVGIPKDEVRIKNKKNIQKTAQSKQQFNNFLESLIPEEIEKMKIDEMKKLKEGKITLETYQKTGQDFKKVYRKDAGIQKNIHKVYIRYGHALQDLIKKNYKGASSIFDEKAESELEFQYLARLGNALAEWMVVDFIDWKTKDDELNESIKENNIPKTDLTILTGKLRQRFKDFKSGKKLSSISKEMFDEIIKGRKTSNKIYEDLEKNYSDFLKNKKAFETIKLKAKVEELENKIFGNYRTNSHDIKKTLEEMAKKILDFAKSKNLSIVHQEGPFIYFQGGTKETYARSEVDSIDKVIITSKGEDKKIYYKNYGFFHGIKSKEHPDYTYTMFDMQTYTTFLDLVFDDKSDIAISHIESEKQRLEKRQVNLEDLVFLNKDKEIYHAYEEEGTIKFYTNLKKIKQGTEILYDYYRQRNYILVPVKEEKPKKENNDDTEQSIQEELFYEKDENVEDKNIEENPEDDNVKWEKEENTPKIKTEKIYIMNISELNPDWNRYIKRNREKYEEFMTIFPKSKRNTPQLSLFN
ncbi:MAG: hypothetical protein WC755_03570 [Candidatus Woesearchaeota archaeon]|jgi:hypothetical protein